jgi:hypothetical protein
MICENYTHLINISPNCNELRGRCHRFNAIVITHNCKSSDDQRPQCVGFDERITKSKSKKR